MGKSTASCFRIISCGGDSVDPDDLQTPESKASSDRRGWSFRKKSAGHRVLSNSVTSEAPASASKESQESISVSCQVQPDLTVAEKTIEIQPKEEKKTELSSFLDSKLSDTQASIEDTFGEDASPDEPSIILIQTAIRGFLARRVLLKQKSITKLQAVVRGHIVRSHAVGTLRCVQAIIKMQALVRARHSRLLVDGSGYIPNHGESNGQSKKEAKATGAYTYVSIEKLLSNAFARQLMEATPKTQPINIKCDPAKSDSAWKWLERWMSVSSVSDEERQETEAAVEQHVDDIGHSGRKDVDLGHSGRKEEDLFVQIISKPTDSESGVDASDEVSNDNNMTSYEANDLDPHSNKSISPLSIHCNLQNSDQSDTRCELKELAPSEMKQTDLAEVMEPDLPKKEELQNDEEIPNELVEVEYLPQKEETGIDQNSPNSEYVSTAQPETEVKCFSRKASNPAFIAAQSKFEELSLAATSAKVTPSHDPEESNLDKVSSATQDQPLRSEDKDNGVAGNSISNVSVVQKGSSDCGTELSISSTLDSPDRSEAGVNDRGMDTKLSDETDNARNTQNLEVEAKSILLETDPSSNNTTKLERYESVDSVSGESLNSSILIDTPRLEKKPEDQIHLQVELGSETSHQVNKLSPEASPRSHATIPESQATPSSQVSVKPKKSKGEKSRSNRKSKPSSDDKNLSNHNQDSASRSSLEQLQEHKSGKRRNSFGSAKPDHKEQEPRDSSSSNSLPSYMQATESARAKAIANGSPRSSPDVNDKDTYIKKRHSLPSTNERQGSPRIHRSLSQAQQNTKGNASHSPQDRKWRR